MKNKGTFDVLGVKGKNVIVYIENGVVKYLDKYSFDYYNEAKAYLEDHKEELDNFVTELKAAEARQREEQEKNRKEKEAADKLAREEKEKKKALRKQKFVSYVAGFLSAVLFLTGGHFVAKGISSSLKDRDSKKPSTSQTGDLDPTVTTEPTQTTDEKNKYTYNYDENAVVINGTEYIELTTEKFEELTSLIVKKYSDAGLTVSSENIIKYVMIANLDKLSQDNRELKTEIIGQQDTDEVFADADLVVGAVLMYNYNVYYETGKTDGFIWPSDVIFDETEKAKVVEIENRVKEIAASVDDNSKMNKLVHDLLIDLTNPESELSYLEAGAGYLVQWIVIEPIRGLFGMDLYGNITLDDTNAQLIKYYVTYAGDEQTYIDNSLTTAYNKNILALLNDCPGNTRKREQ